MKTRSFRETVHFIADHACTQPLHEHALAAFHGAFDVEEQLTRRRMFLSLRHEGVAAESGPQLADALRS